MSDAPSDKQLPNSSSSTGTPSGTGSGGNKGSKRPADTDSPAPAPLSPSLRRDSVHPILGASVAGSSLPPPGSPSQGAQPRLPAPHSMHSPGPPLQQGPTPSAALTPAASPSTSMAQMHLHSPSQPPTATRVSKQLVFGGSTRGEAGGGGSGGMGGGGWGSSCCCCGRRSCCCCSCWRRGHGRRAWMGASCCCSPNLMLNTSLLLQPSTMASNCYPCTWVCRPPLSLSTPPSKHVCPSCQHLHVSHAPKADQRQDHVHAPEGPLHSQ